jgi:hypothetical protein
VGAHRLFYPDYSHMAVARWLRCQARTGFQRGGDEHTMKYVARCTCGVNLPVCPNSVSLILTRDMTPGCTFGWHFSICCVHSTGYRGYVSEEGEHWLEMIFGKYKHLAAMQPLTDRSSIGVAKDLRNWILEVDWKDRTNPAVDLEACEID